MQISPDKAADAKPPENFLFCRRDFHDKLIRSVQKIFFIPHHKTISRRLNFTLNSAKLLHQCHANDDSRCSRAILYTKMRMLLTLGALRHKVSFSTLTRRLRWLPRRKPRRKPPKRKRRSNRHRHSAELTNPKRPCSECFAIASRLNRVLFLWARQNAAKPIFPLILKAF